MTKFSEVNRIIFDLDNTLIKHNFEEENMRIAKYLGLEDSSEFREQFDSMFKNNSKYLKNKIVTKEYFACVIEKLMPILKNIGVTGADLLDIIDRCHSRMLMEDAKELLEYLTYEGYQIVALTNWFAYYQLNVLKKLGIAEYFERIYGWDDYYAKPNHFSIIRALESTEAKHNVMIGDDVRGDIILPKSVGVKAIGFNVNYGKYKKDVKADVDVTRLIDIKKYL